MRKKRERIIFTNRICTEQNSQTVTSLVLCFARHSGQKFVTNAEGVKFANPNGIPGKGKRNKGMTFVNG